MAIIGFYLLLVPLYILSLLPLKVLYLFSDFLAFFLRVVIRYRSDIVHINIARSFPDINYKGVYKISKDFYRNISDLLIEFIASVSASKAKYCSNVEIENALDLKPFYDQGRSVLIVLGHQANWENLAVLDTSLSGFTAKDLRIVYKKQSNRSAGMLVNWIRTHNNDGEFIESGEIARYMFTHRSEQLLYVLIADQSPLPGAKFAVNFLNQPTYMLNGPEYLAKKLNLPVVYANNTRVDRGKYMVRFSIISSDPSKNEDGEISRKFASLLEAGIRANPSAWLWSHRRWKRSVNELKNSKPNKDE